MDKPWLWVAIICGLVGGVLMRRHEPALYHYEDHVEITGGFYADRAGAVSSVWEDTFGRRSYNVRLDTGELVFRIDEKDLKLYPDHESRR